MNNKRTFQVGLRLDPETLEQYEVIAKRERRTLSNVLRVALQDRLKDLRAKEVSEVEDLDPSPLTN